MDGKDSIQRDIEKVEAQLEALNAKRAALEGEAASLAEASKDRRARIAKAVRDDEPRESLAPISAELRQIEEAAPHQSAAAELVGQEIEALEAALAALRADAADLAADEAEAAFRAAFETFAKQLGTVASELPALFDAVKARHAVAKHAGALAGREVWELWRYFSSPAGSATDVLLKALSWYPDHGPLRWPVPAVKAATPESVERAAPADVVKRERQEAASESVAA